MPRAKKAANTKKVWPKVEPMGRRAPKEASTFVDVSVGPKDNDDATASNTDSAANPNTKEQVEVIPEDKVEVLPPQTSGVITLVVDGNAGTTHIELGGFSLLQGVVYLKHAHNFLTQELNKVVALNEQKEEGPPNPTS